MEEQKGSQPAAFVDLVSYRKISARKTSSKGSIVKANGVELGASRQIEVEAIGPNQPKIILHRVGDTIESVEVVCPCGRHTEIRLEYDGD
ncbi:MAG TPA: hypothetical protein VMG34_05295 [Bacteroidota bacterium]|nr:hypothetical protein [Bacteroidota bacterium]